mgnify:CR=1 FL=1
MDFAHDATTVELRERLLEFMDAHVYPAEPAFAAQVASGEPWSTPPVLEELKAGARAAGLWNLFLPDDRFGPGLTNLQYAPLAEITGRSPQLAPEALNCSAPDTGNMELLHQFGTEDQGWVAHFLIRALNDDPITIYGDGKQVRDWLYVEDHARALIKVATEGAVGETYNIGGHNEKTNLEVVEAICDTLDELVPLEAGGASRRELITFVADRPGHDRRYAIDAGKIAQELGWTPRETFESGLRKTVEWYLKNREWWERVMDGRYQGERLGLARKAA